MYFGSVRFFKHLILSTIGLIFVTLLTLSIVFGVLYSKEKKSYEELNARYEHALSDRSMYIPSDTTEDELFSMLRNKGYATEEILRYLSENDSDAVNKFCMDRFYNPDGTEASYTKLYPELYVTPPAEFRQDEKTVYLTFDDGPSQRTLEILTILKKYDIKATFFMSGSETAEGKAIMKKVADEGHSIGIHSNLHDYGEIYKNVDNYLADFEHTSNIIYEATGVKPDICRFPGGSINNFNRFIYKQLISEITRRGYVYYDWNVSGEDANVNATWTSIYRNVLNNMENQDRAVILLHDSAGKEATVSVVEDLIIELQRRGYSFDKLDHEVKPITFTYIEP